MNINTPFCYTGNKFKLLDQLLPKFDYTKDVIIDLFCGGGSIYTNIVDKYNKIIVNDVIGDLIGIHKGLIESDDIIEQTKILCPNKDDQDGYNKLRNEYNDNPNSPALFALMLSCTNNMMRFNKSMKFNQSFGRRSWSSATEKKIYEFIYHIRPYKDKIEFKSETFNNIPITENTFYYIDPPYLETEAGYNSYFSNKDGELLYDYIKNINKNNSTFMISGIIGNHKNGKRSKLIDDLISDGFNYEILDFNYEKVSRNKNSKNSKEIIIFNY